MNDSNLLFIISQPRSGSTLLQNIISNNNFVNTVSEPWILLPYLSVLKSKIQTAVYDSNLSKIGIEEYIQKLDINEYFKKNTQIFLLKLYLPLFLPEIKFVLDKTPRYYEILDEIIEYFPNSKIIILKRNPLDVLNSIIQTWNVKNLQDLYTYSRDILLAPFFIQNFLEKNNTNQNVIEIYYENLVSNPAKEISKLFTWLGIEYNSSFLDYKKNTKAEGRMGDQIGIKKYSSIQEKQNAEAILIKESKYWKKFFAGYSNYLYNKNLLDFNKFNLQDDIPTRMFNDFILANNIRYYDKKHWNLKQLYNLLKFKLKDKIYYYSA